MNTASDAAADRALARHRDEPEGELRIAAPIGFGKPAGQGCWPFAPPPPADPAAVAGRYAGGS
ncbi:MAG: hypothetical protein MZV65_13940 [Chromatiales bacterium]|nr:hypothetical protein [Chromatiales bacterium]